MDRYEKALKKVIKDWGFFELLLIVIFFPYSILYVCFRVLQELDSEEKG